MHLLAGRYGCKVWSLDSKLPHNNPAVLLFYPWKENVHPPQELFGVVVHINKCSQKGSFGLVWLADHLLYSKIFKKNPQTRWIFPLFQKKKKTK
jgi:hypothetical protein